MACTMIYMGFQKYILGKYLVIIWYFLIFWSDLSGQSNSGHKKHSVNSEKNMSILEKSVFFSSGFGTIQGKLT